MIQKISKILLLFLIILLAIFPRAIDALNGNPIFGFDQGREMLAAKNIVVNHKPILIGTEIGAGVAGISGIFQGPIYYYLLTIPFILFGGNPVGGVYLMLFFGLLSIIFGFYFGRKLFGNLGGVILVLLMSISPALISQSRFLWSPNPPTLFILLSFYFIYLFSKKKNVYVFIAAFFSGFIYNFELAIAVPMSLTLLIYSVFIFRNKIKPYFYLILGFVLGYLPMILFEIRHGLMGLKGLFNYILNSNTTIGVLNINLINEHFSSFLYNFKDAFPYNNVIFSALFFIILIFLFVFLIKREKDVKLKQFLTYLIILFLVNIFVFSFLKNTVWNYYLTDISLAYLIIFTYVIITLYKKKYFKLCFLLFSIFIFFILLGSYSAIKTSIYDYSDYGGTAKLQGKIDAIDYIYKDAKNKKFNLLIFSPPVYTYPYEYLLGWYGKRKYGYVPQSEKKNTFYLLIEPDPLKPWSYKGWLETVVKSGNIKSTVVLPNGFIVQKRVEK
jgi:4-amino-4-deoxy-L-arabinose transferase-like glycosyltransferase